MRQRTLRHRLSVLSALALAGLTTILTAALAFASHGPGQWP
ncbi:MAG TPA: hypothetical protein VFK93_03860 [Candidatus Limnocylindria bacterium]|jgi:hypothetical protein|nr:hypothetical protein [Candidatus Limnocylindria bacterium]